MVNVQEVFQLAIKIDMAHLVHRIFWAIAKGKIKVEEEAISKMVARNQLSIGKIKLYVVETRVPELFAFYYSENVLDVHALHQDKFERRQND